MKRTLILFLVLTIFINCLTAQVTLQHTFTGNISQQGQLTPKLDYYLSIDETTNQVRFYNPDFSLYKTVNINLQPGYTLLSCGSASKGLIYQDNKIVFFAMSYNYTSGTSCNLRMYNEDGVVLKDFGVSADYMYYWIIKIDEEFKLLINYTDDRTEVYSLPGQTQTSVSSTDATETLSPYPNPSKYYITIPLQGKDGRLEIYNPFGQYV